MEDGRATVTDALQSTTFRLYSSAAAPVTGAAAPRHDKNADAPNVVGRRVRIIPCRGAVGCLVAAGEDRLHVRVFEVH